MERIASSEILFAEQRDSHMVQTIVWLRNLLLCSLPYLVGSRIHFKIDVNLPMSKQKLPAQVVRSGICAFHLQLLHVHRQLSS